MPTPADAAPAVVQRTRLVEQMMESLEDVETLSVAEQLTRLSQAQELLNSVLNNADVSQLRIPGLG